MITDILSQIVAHKLQEIEWFKSEIPEHRIKKNAQQYRAIRSFLNALKQPGAKGINIIAEIKRASPSKGVIRHDLNPVLLAREYEIAGAAALSVLTDQRFFQGSFEDLQAARNAVHLPVLRKDFIISPYQIYQSAAIGADAILLIARILTKQQLTEYINICHDFQLDVLVEVHSEQELEVATGAGAQLIGINNRNLKTFQTDIQTAIRLAPLLAPYQIAVAESGIRSAEDIRKSKEAGIFNFLIGETLVRSSNIQEMMTSLMTI